MLYREEEVTATNDDAHGLNALDKRKTKQSNARQ